MSNKFIDAFSFVSDRWSDLIQEKVIEHLILSGEAIAVSIIIGVPLGCFLGHIHRFSFLAINTSNVARALPTVAVLAILLPYTGLGDTTAIIALVVLAAPPILTNSYVAVDQVDVDTVDAARGIGLTPWQVLLRVEMPLALPLVFAGIRTSAVFVVATATLKGFFGGGGLGDIISNLPSYGQTGVIGGSYVLIVLAIAAQIVFLGVEYAMTPVGLRRQKSVRKQVKKGGSLPGAPAAEISQDESTEEASSEASQLEEQGISTR
ncbi:MAG: ABC transporter permease [Gordonia polyisoprenivorans]|nr:ABC transporter permease [Gordonia polyisoprenivorans]